MPKRPQILIQRARRLRGDQTDAEGRLWRALRGRQLEAWKFRRQHAVGPYIADFVCLEAGLVLELDGGQHAEDAERDARRTAYLQGQGFRVLRFWNHDVLQNPEGVLEAVRAELAARPSPRPSPPRGEGGHEAPPAAPLPGGEPATASPLPSGGPAPASPLPSGEPATASPLPSGEPATASPLPSGGPATASPLPSGERVRVRGKQPLEKA